MRIGIDLGGTKIEIIALDDAGRTRLRRRVATPRGDYDATLRTVVQLVRDAEAEVGVRARVGIGTPGSASPANGLMRNANSVCLNGRALRDDLERLLGRDIRMANDANCFALSEAMDGAGAGAHCVFGVILGTGVGGGLVVDGRVLEGSNGIAGEWGHNPLCGETPEQAPACCCGRRGCIETWLSGPGLLADHARQGGREPDVPAIVEGAVRGDPQCEATLARYERRLARALAVVINIVDPEVIVLGGGLSNIARLYERVPQLWREHIFSDVVRTRLLPNRHGDSSGVRGAAWL
ncbi:MAG TPA: ROK family protein [Burkholderiales bacterium]|nr:ROK family protein [Burkholderiales bacterium]